MGIDRNARQIIGELPFGKAIVHEIDTETSGFFLLDGVHISPIGDDLLLHTLQEAIYFFHK